MNEDLYAEWIVKRKTPAYMFLVKVALIALVLVGLTACVFSQWGFVVLLITVLAAYFGFQYTSVEYEYIFVSNEFGIDKIYSKSRRKKDIRLDMGKVVEVAPIAGHELDSYKNNQKVKVVDYSSREPNAKTYGIVYEDNGTTFYIIEPNEKMLKTMKACSPRKVQIAQ